MPRFRKKPVEIEAVQWTGDNLTEVAELIEFDLNRERFRTGTTWDPVLYATDDQPPALVMTMVHGETAVARVDDWVIPEPKPEHAYPCRPDIFEATYDAVES